LFRETFPYVHVHEHCNCKWKNIYNGSYAVVSFYWFSILHCHFL
jgi:hypothetical protein